VPTVVLHFGDRDRDGENIYRVLVEDLTELSYGSVEDVVRVALTPEQMHDMDASATTMQVDALPVPMLRQALADAITARQDIEARLAALRREQGERAQVKAWATRPIPPM
jgi:hypothetical protein